MAHKFLYAPLLNRIFASIIDYFISMFIFIIIGLPLYFSIRQGLELGSIDGVWFLFLFLPLILWSYYIFTEYRWGFTLGKKITGLRVICQNNAKLTITNAILRTVFKIIPFNSFSIIFSKQNRGWHDKIVGTIVVRDYTLD